MVEDVVVGESGDTEVEEEDTYVGDEEEGSALTRY